MNFADLAPADFPTLDQQLDALRQGLGRAVQWARAGRLDDEPLRAACLRDLRFDSQLDDARGDWLWGMIEAVGAADQLRGAILDDLTHLPDERNAEQLCGLARHYAARGDEAFRQRLRAIVADKPIADRPWLGEEELILVEGEPGFLFAARVQGQRPVEEAWDSDAADLVRSAAEQFGAERVGRLLSESAALDEAVARFEQAWRRHEAVCGQARRERVRPPARPVAEVIEAAATQEHAFWLRRWGQSASEAELRTVLDHLWAGREPRVVAKLLQVFCGRALPEFDTRLIELSHHDDLEVQSNARIALGQNAHPLIRDLALTELARGVSRGGVIGLLARNFEPGDEARILAAVQPPDDEDERHWFLMEVLDVLKVNPEADGSRLGLVVYALTPCGHCRAKAIKILLNQGAAPDWLRAECRSDANEDCRQLVEADPAG